MCHSIFLFPLIALSQCSPHSIASLSIFFPSYIPVRDAVAFLSHEHRRNQINLYLSSCKTMNYKYVKDFNMEPNILKLIEEKVKKSWECTSTRDNYLNRHKNKQLINWISMN